MNWIRAWLPEGSGGGFALRMILGFAICFGLPSAHAFQLVTDDEFQRDLVTAEVLDNGRHLRGAATGPVIQLLAPSLGQSLISPLRIEIRFIPAEGSEVDVESIRVFYGRLRLDVTERILKHARIGKDGLLAERAELPNGSHRFFIRIADTLQRVAEREVSVTILPPEGNRQ